MSYSGDRGGSPTMEKRPPPEWEGGDGMPVRDRSTGPVNQAVTVIGVPTLVMALLPAIASVPPVMIATVAPGV